MDKGKKRERNVNFTREETDKLVSLVEAYKNIVENKKSDAVTWQEKEKAWMAIEGQFNSSGGGAFRDAKHLKLKYEALKRNTRKKCSVIRAERYKIGGGPNESSPLTPVEQKVKEMILLSVEGGESTFDSDELVVAESEESSGVGFLAETPSQPINVKETLTFTDEADYSSNIVLEVPIKLPKKRCLPQADDAVPSISKEIDQDVLEIPQKKWAEWKPASLKSNKHPALFEYCKPKEKRPFDRLAEGKLEIVSMQKELIKEELEEILLKKQLLQNEIQHKQEIHYLMKEEMLLKIDILKRS